MKGMKRKVTIIVLLIFTVFISFVDANISKSDKNIYDTKIDNIKYPNSSAAILLDYTRITINSDSTYTKTRRVVKRVLNYKGKKENSEYKITFDKRYENIEINKAVTIKEENKKYIEIPIDKSAMREIDLPSESGFMDYAVHKMRISAFSSVESNDIVDIEYTKKNNKKDKFTDIIIFGYKEPIYKIYYEIIMPENMSIKFNKLEGVTFKEKKIGDMKLYIWESEKLPQILREQGQPEWSYFTKTLFITVYSDWNQFKNDLLKQYNDKIKITESIKNLTDMIINRITDDRKKVNVISKYIAKNIDSKPVNSLTDFDLRNVDDIIKSGYAASFDRIALFLTMMKYIGIESYPVAVGPKVYYWDKRKDCLQPNDFKTMICKIKIDNKEYYINPESEFYPLGYINYSNNIGLLIKEDNVKFETIMSDSLNRNRKENVKTIRIDSKGNAIISVKSLIWGDEAVKKRESFTYITPIKKKQAYEEIINTISQNAEPVSKDLKIVLGNPVQISFKYRYNNFATIDRGFVYFDIPIDQLPFNLAIEPDDRKYPYLNRDNDNEAWNISVNYPKSYKTILKPENIKVEDNTFSIEKYIESQRGCLKIKGNVKKKPYIVSLDEYNEFYNKVIKLAHPRYYKVLMKK
ncbi:hypothetical protein DRP43_00600 [candidate division TA06 bacterium]|uniref:DUF3857 domain-containing protein n=1 Tax=candidate division TA06 bacterium TaxID=2250710 RepID=A0A660SNY4_UNCT6|nr:MAG: hypothetical protein DRP43_00600 [candidate division TA06 bacterium]